MRLDVQALVDTIDENGTVTTDDVTPGSTTIVAAGRFDGPLAFWAPYDPKVAEEQDIASFDELVRLLRGMRANMVEARILLPWDDDGFSVATFSGILKDVEFMEASPSPRCVLSWMEEGELKPQYPQVAIWERRFVRAKLSFTGEVEDGLGDSGEVRGQCIFLKVYCEGWILDLIGYVAAD